LLIDRRARPTFYLLIFISALSLHIGCGAPGEPAERKSPIPVAITDLAGSQQGNDVVLTFTLPKESIEHKPLKQLPAIEIYRSFETIPMSANSAPQVQVEPPGSAPLVTIPPEMVTHFLDRNQFRYVDALTAEDFSQNPSKDAVYVVRTRTSPKKISASSNSLSLPIHPAADPISDLKLEITREAIVLTWIPPQKTLVGGAPRIAAYSVYRSESDSAAFVASEGTGQKIALAHIGDVPGPPFRDLQIQFGKKYTYSVRSVVQYDQTHIESADSNTVSGERLDTFPPSAPEGLVAALVPAQDQSAAYFDLSWSISPDNDIAGYNIYRSEGAASARNKLNQTLLLTPAFRDMKVVPGRSYVYTATSVTRAGNESPESTPTTGDVPDTGSPAAKQPQ
jgi:hypothetical protein